MSERTGEPEKADLIQDPVDVSASFLHVPLDPPSKHKIRVAILAISLTEAPDSSTHDEDFQVIQIPHFGRLQRHNSFSAG
jgi:hypothetical protein